MDSTAQFDLVDAFDEGDEAIGLDSQAVQEFGVVQPAGVVEVGMDVRDENALGINEGVAVAEDGLKLFNRPQRTPDAGGDTDEAHGPFLEALGKLEHVDEIFQDAGDAAVVFRRDDDETGGPEDGVGKGMKGFWFFGVGSWRKYFGRQLGEVEDMEGDVEGGVNFLDVPGNLAGVAAGPVRANDERQHEKKIRRRKREANKFGARSAKFIPA